MQELQISSRVKTRTTLVEKLQREKSRLSSVQDVAGARVQLESTSIRLPVRPISSIEDQDRLVQAIIDEFPAPRIVDRRASPSAGYRAIHIIVEVGKLPVEVQVRTALQHAWAETYERLADVVGREVRYLPVESLHVREEWRLLVDAMQAAAVRIATHEAQEVTLASLLESAIAASIADAALSSEGQELVGEQLELAVAGFSTTTGNWLAMLTEVQQAIGRFK